jgi:hypothetical protein
MGVVLVMTLLLGRLAWQRQLMEKRPNVVRGIVAFGIFLGAGFYALDLTDALAQKHALEQAAAAIPLVRQPGQTVWFTGHWGFQFYAQRAAYQPVVPDHSLLRTGDWLVYPHAGIDDQRVSIPLPWVEQIAEIRIDDPVPLACVPFYYGAAVPVQHRYTPRVWLSVYRIKTDFVPLTSYPPQYIADWAVNRRGPLPPASIAAVLRAIPQVDPATAAQVLKAVRASEASGPIRP